MINLIAEGHLRQRRNLAPCPTPGQQKAGASCALPLNDTNRPRAGATGRLAERRAERLPAASR